MTILRPEAFLLFIPAAAAVAVSFRFESRARLWRERFSASSRFDDPHSLFPGRFRTAALALSLFCAVCALARPVWNPHSSDATESGQDALFLVDVSRSMNTSDVSASGESAESRLEAVKNALSDLVPTLSGDRTALVAFAGTSVPKCPLTTDRVFFSNAVRLLDAGSTSRGGTLLGDALRMIKKNFVPSSKNLSVWVFTDGGDQESFPVEAARALADSGVRLYIWGVGSTTGAEVPERGVVSALDEDLLRRVAAAVPGGEYFGSGTPLWRLSAEYGARRKPTASTTSSYTFWDEGAWFLLWPIFLLLLALPLVRIFPGRLFSSLLVFAVFFASSCSIPANGALDSDAGWQSPADEASLARLSGKTLEKGLSDAKRAQLFYLYGQESAASGATEAAIAAFERVVDLRSVLSEESRINLEILYRRREQEQQEAEQSSADSKQNADQSSADGKQNAEQSSAEQSSAGDKQNAEQSSANGKQNAEQSSAGDKQNAEQSSADGKQQNAEQSSAEQSSAAEQQKDLSALVREKAGSSALEQALRAEAERMNQKQQLEAGNAVPVEKDW